MTCSAAVASYFVAALHNKECTAQSLVKALETFLREVQEMRDVIMVPNRLRGVPTPKIDKPTDQGVRRFQKRASSKNCTALLPIGSRALLPYEVNGFIATEGYLREDSKPENRRIQTQQQENFAWPEDLFRRYRVVQALRRELLTDRSSNLEAEDDENDDEQTRILTARFRQYLSGLFDVLEQLTDMSKDLSHWYQEEVNGNAKRP